MIAWRPLLDGDDAARATAAIEQIAEALAGRAIALDDGRWSLARGEPGIGLFFAYLAAATGRDEAREQAEERIAAALEYAAGAADSPWLWTGLAGVAWAAEQALALEPGDDLDEDPHEQVDDVLLAALDAPAHDLPYELMNGVAGLGIYARERLPRPGARALLDRVVARLCEQAAPRDTGVAWFRAPRSLSASERAIHPRGFHALGVAHGVLGPIAVLGAAGSERATEVARAGLRWLWEQRLPATGASRFAYAAESTRPHFTGWCYGDAGAAAVAGTLPGSIGDDWLARAHELAVEIARRDPAACRLDDASLCHGTFGLAHLLNRLAQRFGDAELASAARDWFRRGLALHQPGAGIGGFAVRDLDPATREPGPPLAGMLDGSAGIGLALIAATTAVPPRWDRAFGYS